MNAADDVGKAALGQAGFGRPGPDEGVVEAVPGVRGHGGDPSCACSGTATRQHTAEACQGGPAGGVRVGSARPHLPAVAASTLAP